MTNETQNKLEILIVEDREENRNAAKAALKDKINIDFATNYEDGLKKLQTKVYAFGIFDVELPRKDEMKTEKLGFELENEAYKYGLDYALITAGIDHHQCRSAFVKYYFDGKESKDFAKKKKELRKYYDDHNSDIRARNFHEITEVPKTSPKAWERVYETLLEVSPNVKDMVKTKKKYLESFGKMYIMREGK